MTRNERFRQYARTILRSSLAVYCGGNDDKRHQLWEAISVLEPNSKLMSCVVERWYGEGVQKPVWEIAKWVPSKEVMAEIDQLVDDAQCYFLCYLGDPVEGIPLDEWDEIHNKWKQEYDPEAELARLQKEEAQR